MVTQSCLLFSSTGTEADPNSAKVYLLYETPDSSLPPAAVTSVTLHPEDGCLLSEFLLIPCRQIESNNDDTLFAVVFFLWG